jgi:hypothetical protein
MAKEKSLVEEAILSMKNLEEAVANNAKEILASTMKEEIKELVKESLSEQDEEEVDTDVDMSGDEDEMSMDIDMEDSEEDMDTDNEVEDMASPIDLRGKSNDEIIRVFQLMGPDDNIIVTKDDAGNINLKTNEDEYMIVGESEEEQMEMYMDDDDEMNIDMDMDMDLEEDMDMEDSEESMEDIINSVFNDEEDEYDSLNIPDDMPSYKTKWSMPSKPEEERNGEMFYEIEMDEEDMEEGDDVMYEITLGDDSEQFEEEDPYMMESKKAKTPKTGKASSFKYSTKPNMDGGFEVPKRKKANTTMGTGSAKKVDVYKDDETLDGKMKIVKGKKAETKEASRTYASGSKKGRGLRKGITPNRNLEFPIRESVYGEEVQVLREKNEEYRKALNVFRNKLNEVAVFNSNLAYATRLFTEHSTSKQEKINILKRFDGVESLKESKNLYKTIKDELSVKTSQPMNESIERKIENVQNTGSAVNLIESKTYENPQFMRMKDLMSKLK